MEDYDQKIERIKQWLGTGSINIFGRPFAGKDTQAERIAQLLGGVQLGGGHILRNSSIPDNTKAIMETGALIPSDAYVDIVLPYLSSDEFSNRPLILSSVGRMDGEQHGVIQATHAAHHPLKAVIYLDIDEDTVHHRWHVLHTINQRGREREDDSLHLLDTRLEWFRMHTLPVIKYYRENGLCIDIDGHHSEDDVTVLIVDMLAKHAS